MNLLKERWVLVVVILSLSFFVGAFSESAARGVASMWLAFGMLEAVHWIVNHPEGPK